MCLENHIVAHRQKRPTRMHKDNNKLHIRPDTHAVYAVPGSLKIEGILFLELTTKIDDNR